MQLSSPRLAAAFFAMASIAAGQFETTLQRLDRESNELATQRVSALIVLI